jgi:hypothetical protein
VSADLLEAALRATGMVARVEARGGLAIVIADPAAFADPTLRERAAALAREHGFTHVAVELPPESPRASLPGD